MGGLWADRGYLRGEQYKTEGNLAARQSIYAYQVPRFDLAAVVLDLAGPAHGATVVDVGCGNGLYLAELARRRFTGRVLGADLSTGMLAACRDRVASAVRAAGRDDDPAAGRPEAGERATATTVTVTVTATATATGLRLIGGDASALPLRDGAADLTLAMHMLYHVPDPAAAVRELRRVTRPGGRVVVGLDGAAHLAELRALIAAATGADPAALGERVGLDEGAALLRTAFSSVTRHDFAGEVRVPAPGPVADYVRSTAYGARLADQEAVVAEVVARAFPSGTASIPFTITTHVGVLLCG